MEAFDTILLRNKELGLFKDLKVGEGEHMEKVTHLFFTNDTLVFCEPDEMIILNYRYILLSFQAVS